MSVIEIKNLTRDYGDKKGIFDADGIVVHFCNRNVIK